jgi:DNA recombination protein RmuC
LEIAIVVVVALVAGFAAGWLLASRSRAAQQDQLRETFQALAATTLKASTDEFLKLADQKIGNVHKEASFDLGKRQQELDSLVAPIRDTLAQVGIKLNEVERQRISDTAGIRSTLEAVQHANQRLEREAQSLVKALRTPNVRGRWGEVQLRRVVELAGMVECCDFEEQPTLFSDTGQRFRPDVTIRLPGNRTVVVDAKVPLEAYLNAQEATDEAARAKFMAAHARQVRDHMQKLGSKSYWEQLESSPEMVVMFLPGESFFQAALNEDVALIEFGVEQKVFPASPITLIALLRAVEHGWREERIARNASDISELGRELYNRVATMTGYLDDLRGRLDGAVQSYNKVVGSFEGRVLVQARKFRDLGASTADDIPIQEQITTSPRAIQTGLMGLGEENGSKSVNGDHS